MTPDPYTRAELDAGRCMVEHEHGEECGGGEALYIHGACHPAAGNEVAYEAGVLTINCQRCKKLIIKIRVADPPSLAIFNTKREHL